MVFEIFSAPFLKAFRVSFSDKTDKTLRSFLPLPEFVEFAPSFSNLSCNFIRHCRRECPLEFDENTDLWKVNDSLLLSGRMMTFFYCYFALSFSNLRFTVRFFQNIPYGWLFCCAATSVAVTMRDRVLNNFQIFCQ